MQSDVANRLIRCLSLLIMVVMFSQASLALNIRHRKSGYVEPKYPWSFQIALDESLENDDYHGLRLSLSHQYSKYAAIRFNLGFVGRDVDYSSTSIFYSDWYGFEIDHDRDFDITGVNLGLQLLAYPSPDDNVRFFWGIGPRLSIDEAYPDEVFFYENDFSFDWYEVLDSDDFTKVGLGLEGLVGLEWFLGRNVSLLAEYGLIVQNEWYVIDYEYYDPLGYHRSETESFDDGLHVDASRIKLGLALHF